jgi:protein-tyrosine phosphatase
MADGHENHRWGVYKQTDLSRGAMDRYANVKPWNHNRVRLRVPPNEYDYVNASTVSLKSPSDKNRAPLRYIAMQGPTEASVDYVWRMISEQLPSPAVIVQLTNMYENHAQKCFPYLPMTRLQGSWTLNTNDIWNDGWGATLGFASLETLENGAIEVRKLLFHVDGEESPRIVWHLLYKKWPDFGVPALEDIDSFFTLMRLSREYSRGVDTNKSRTRPTATNGNHHDDEDVVTRIVHCSAGVGRTGTFITLEHLIRELESGSLENYDLKGEKPDLVFETVECLREQRRMMVQSESQYLFIYQVMRKLWQDKYGVDEDENDGGAPAAKRLEVVDPFFE